MGRPHSLPEILEAINGSSGIKIVIAQRLGVHRNTVNNYLKRYTSAQQAYEDEVQKVGDFAESVVIRAIQGGDVDTAQWYCRVKLKDRGYGEQKQEQAQAQQQAVTIIIQEGDKPVAFEEWLKTQEAASKNGHN